MPGVCLALDLVIALFVMRSFGRAVRVHKNHIMLDGSCGPWNQEQIPFETAEGVLGWNLPMDVVGAGVYGGIAKRNSSGALILGFEWPENNGDWAQGPHCRIAPHRGTKSPYLDFTRYTSQNRGYARISNLVTSGDVSRLRALFNALGTDRDKRRRLANLVMAGGARPLHMAGMTRGGNPAAVVELLLNEGADPNALDCYAMTPLDRMQSNGVASQTLLKAGGRRGTMKTEDVAEWSSEQFSYEGGIGEYLENVRDGRHEM
jgi:hypothetical protein